MLPGADIGPGAPAPLTTDPDWQDGPAPDTGSPVSSIGNGDGIGALITPGDSPYPPPPPAKKKGFFSRLFGRN